MKTILQKVAEKMVSEPENFAQDNNEIDACGKFAKKSVCWEKVVECIIR